MSHNIISCWNRVMPTFDPRNSQMDTFKWIESLDPHIKYILLEMPVGGGKSPVGLTLSSYFANNGYGSSFVLTPQKILQKQYEDSFSKELLSSVYGKANYRCEKKNCSCDVGSSIKPKCANCPHKIAFGMAKQSPNMVLNYTLALLYFMYIDPEALPARKLMILDECHNLESSLVDFSTYTISEKNCLRIQGEYYSPKGTRDGYNWIRESYFPKLIDYLKKLSREKADIEESREFDPDRPLTADEEAVIKSYIKYARHADLVHTSIARPENEFADEYVMINEKGKTYFTMKELYGKRVFNDVLKPKAEKFLFMSSTILNKDGFCRDLGIDPKQTAFLELQSEFKPENRRVIYLPTTKMSYGWDTNQPERVTGRKAMIEAVKGILDMHKEDSGIIHAGSFKISQWLINELATHSDHYILNHNPGADNVKVNRDDVIKEYTESAKVRPTILISPSITEGLDLKDELGRISIFVKVPYPSLADQWVKRRMEASKEWYQRQALIAMIQGSGRVCRSDTDFGTTYILDESFTFLYNMTKRKTIPAWWEEALEII